MRRVAARVLNERPTGFAVMESGRTPDRVTGQRASLNLPVAGTQALPESILKHHPGKEAAMDDLTWRLAIVFLVVPFAVLGVVALVMVRSESELSRDNLERVKRETK